MNDVLSEINLKTESQVFRKAAEHFDFKLLEHRGKCYAMRRELVSIFGYIEESGLRKLCKRYGLEGIKLGELGHDARDLAVNALGLSRNDGKTIFLDWSE